MAGRVFWSFRTASGVTRPQGMCSPFAGAAPGRRPSTRDYAELSALRRHERDLGPVVWVIGSRLRLGPRRPNAFARRIDAGFVHGLLAGKTPWPRRVLEAAYLKTAAGAEHLHPGKPARRPLQPPGYHHPGTPSTGPFRHFCRQRGFTTASSVPARGFRSPPCWQAPSGRGAPAPSCLGGNEFRRGSRSCHAGSDRVPPRR